MASSGEPHASVYSVSEFPCVECGYDLRGLSMASKCPECGTQVARSLNDTLEIAEPHWLDSVVLGLKLLRFSILLCSAFLALPILAFAAALGVALLTGDFTASAGRTINDVVRWVGQGTFLAGIVLGSISIALLTRPERRDQRETLSADRYVARFGIGAAALLGALWVLVLNFTMSLTWQIIGEVLLCGTVLAITVVCAAVSRELVDIAQRARMQALVDGLESHRQDILIGLPAFGLAVAGIRILLALNLRIDWLVVGLVLAAFTSGYVILTVALCMNACSGSLRRRILSMRDSAAS